MKNRIAGRAAFQKSLAQICLRFVAENKNALKKREAVVIGIQTRGAPLAKRIAALLKKKYGFSVSMGSLDITLYRDDIGEIGNQPVVKESSIPFLIEGKTILLVDDVLYTGRTIRAALDALLELGRPRTVRLAVMVDRGGRELPIQADYAGAKMSVDRNEEIQLKIKEVDGEDSVWAIDKNQRQRK